MPRRRSTPRRLALYVIAGAALSILLACLWETVREPRGALGPREAQGRTVAHADAERGEEHGLDARSTTVRLHAGSLRGTGTARYSLVAGVPPTVTVSGHVLDERGQPVVGCVVRRAFELDLHPTSCTTDAHGNYALRVPARTGELRVRIPGGLGACDLVGLPETEAHIRLRRTGTLTGVVRAHDRHRPVAGAEVRLRLSGTVRTLRTTTRSDGVFRIEAVPIGHTFDLHIEAEAAGRRAFLDRRYAPVHLEIDLPPVHTVRGRVVSEPTKGTPSRGVEGVRVRFWQFSSRNYGGTVGHVWSHQGAGVLSDRHGGFSHPGIVHSGYVSVESEHWGAGDRLGLIDQPPGPQIEIRVHALATPPPKAERPMGPADVHGLVHDKAKRPIAGARVRISYPTSGQENVFRYAHAETRTDASGQYSLPGQRGTPLDLLVTADGFDSLTKRIYVSSAPGRLDAIELESTHTWVVLVVDEAGAPVPSATVGSEPVGPDGRLTVHLPAGARRRLQAPGFWPSRVSPRLSRRLLRRPTDAEAVKRIVLARAHVVRGQVLDARGQLIRCGTIDWRSSNYGRPGPGARVDLAGRFAIEVPRAGTIRLQVQAAGHVFAPVSVKTGDTQVVIRAVLPRTIAGRVVDPAGLGLEDVEVTARPSDGGDRQSARTDKTGYFRITDLTGNHARLTVNTRSCPAGKHLVFGAFERVPAWTHDLCWVARHPQSLTGTVRWPGGAPAVDVRVCCRRIAERGFTAWADTDDLGRFDITHLLPGRYELTCHAWAMDPEGTPAPTDDDDAEYYFESPERVARAGSRPNAIRLSFIEHVPEEDDGE